MACSEGNPLHSFVIDYAWATKDNLEISLAVIRCQDDIRGYALGEILRYVEESLRKQFPVDKYKLVTKLDDKNDWQTDPIKNKNCPLLLRKNTWPQACGVALNLENNGDIFFGFCAPIDKKRTGDKYFSGCGETEFISLKTKRKEIADFLQKSFPPLAKISNDWWPAVWLLDDLLNSVPELRGNLQKDWANNFETLLILKEKRQEIVSEITKLFIKTADAVSKILDLENL